MTRVDPSLMSPTEEMIGEHKPREHAEPPVPHTKALQLHPDSLLSQDKRDGGCWQVRYTLAILALAGIALMYAMRVVLSIAIVAMVGSKDHHANATHEASNVCSDLSDLVHGDANTSTSIKESVLEAEGEFDWDESIQGVILGSFFWGYCCTNIVGGRAAEYMGGKLVFGLGIVLSAILTVLTPISARISTELLITVRVLGGIVQGVVFPAVNSMLATWIPPTERSVYTTIVFSGFPLGTVVCLPVGGWLCSSGFLDGWPSPFYLFGGLGLLWGVAWFLLIHDRPEHHPRISNQELAHIQSFSANIKRAEVVALPVKDIALSLPFWGLMAGSVGYDFGFYTLLTELPTYLKNIQNFDMSQNGLMSALPFLVMWLWGYVWGSIMDRSTAASLLPLLSVRRLSMAMGMYGPMIGLVLMCFVNCNTMLAMVVLCMAVGVAGSVNCGFLCSHQDLAPNFAGTLLGLTNTVGSFAGILAPMITGSITEGNQTLSAWRWVFLITVAVYCVSNTLYIIFISCEVQPWNEPKTGKEDKEYIVDQEARVTMVSDETRETLLEKNVHEEC